MNPKAKPAQWPTFNIGDEFKGRTGLSGEVVSAVITDTISDESEEMIVIHKRTGAALATRVLLYSLSHMRINYTRHRTRVVPFDDYYFARIVEITPAKATKRPKRANSRTVGKHRPAVC